MLAKETANHIVTAPRRPLAIRDQLLKAGRPALALRFFGSAGTVFGNAPCHAIAFLAAVEHDAGSSFAVAAGAAGFLVVAFEALGNGPVDDEADVLLVDAHAECCRRDYDVETGLVGDPLSLAGDAVHSRKTCVIRSGANRVAP